MSPQFYTFSDVAATNIPPDHRINSQVLNFRIEPHDESPFFDHKLITSSAEPAHVTLQLTPPGMSVLHLHTPTPPDSGVNSFPNGIVQQLHNDHFLHKVFNKQCINRRWFIQSMRYTTQTFDHGTTGIAELEFEPDPIWISRSVVDPDWVECLHLVLVPLMRDEGFRVQLVFKTASLMCLYRTIPSHQVSGTLATSNHTSLYRHASAGHSVTTVLDPRNLVRNINSQNSHLWHVVALPLGRPFSFATRGCPMDIRWGVDDVRFLDSCRAAPLGQPPASFAFPAGIAEGLHQRVIVLPHAPKDWIPVITRIFQESLPGVTNANISFTALVSNDASQHSKVLNLCQVLVTMPSTSDFKLAIDGTLRSYGTKSGEPEMQDSSLWCKPGYHGEQLLCL